MRIILGNPPITKDRQADVVSYPNLGIHSLISYTREHLQNVEFIYLESLDVDEYGEKIEQLKPDIFGISFATFMQKFSYEAINQVRKRMPDLPIICGGPHPTGMPEEVLERSPADVVVIGEGEQTFVDLIQYFCGEGKSLDRIPGIAYRNNEGVVQLTEKRRFMNINDIPMMAWDMIDLNNYKGAHISQMKYSTCILASRGCPFDCVFCSNPVWKSDKPWMRLRDPKLVAEEVLWLYNKGIREIYIRSDELNPNKRWAVDICREIASLGLKDMKFQCNLRSDKVDDELAEALASINCWLVYLGIESFNQRVIDGVEKYIDVSKVPEVCRTLQRHNIKVYGYVMLYQAWEKDGNLCYETTKEVDNTIRQLWKLIRQSHVNYLSWQFATPFPSSRLWNIAEKYGLIQDSSAGVWDMSMSLPGIKQKDMIRQRMLGFLIQAYCGFRSGNLNWSMWKRYLNKIFYILESGWQVMFVRN